MRISRKWGHEQQKKQIGMMIDANFKIKTLEDRLRQEAEENILCIIADHCKINFTRIDSSAWFESKSNKYDFYNILISGTTFGTPL